MELLVGNHDNFVFKEDSSYTEAPINVILNFVHEIKYVDRAKSLMLDAGKNNSSICGRPPQEG